MHSNFLHKYDYRRRLHEADLLGFIDSDWSKLREAQKSAMEEMGEYMSKRSPLNQVFIQLYEYASDRAFAIGELVWVNEITDNNLPPDIRYYKALQANKNIALDNLVYWQPLTEDPRSTVIRDFVVDIALYKLVPANSPVEIANQFRQFYDDAIVWCKVYMKNERPTQLPQESPKNRGIMIAGGKNNGGNGYGGW